MCTYDRFPLSILRHISTFLDFEYRHFWCLHIPRLLPAFAPELRWAYELGYTVGHMSFCASLILDDDDLA